jgi:hypothetical protein
MGLYFEIDLPVELAAFMARSQVFNAPTISKQSSLRLREGTNRGGWW